jgi:hypothetical protein
MLRMQTAIFKLNWLNKYSITSHNQYFRHLSEATKLLNLIRKYYNYLLKFIIYYILKEKENTRTITKCDLYPHKTASEMRMFLVTEYLVKELKYRVMVVAIKDSCGSCMLHFLSMWLAIDKVLLNYSVISPERQGKGTKGNNSINTED